MQQIFTREQLVDFMKALHFKVEIERKPAGRSLVTFIEDHGVFQGQTRSSLRWDKITPLAIANIITQEGYMKEQINLAISQVFKSKNLVNLSNQTPSAKE